MHFILLQACVQGFRLVTVQHKEQSRLQALVKLCCCHQGQLSNSMTYSVRCRSTEHKWAWTHLWSGLLSSVDVNLTAVELPLRQLRNSMFLRFFTACCACMSRTELALNRFFSSELHKVFFNNGTFLLSQHFIHLAIAGCILISLRKNLKNVLWML